MNLTELSDKQIREAMQAESFENATAYLQAKAELDYRIARRTFWAAFAAAGSAFGILITTIISFLFSK